MGQEEWVGLLGGELGVGSQGIVTFVHYYRHPCHCRQVILVGMNHVGERQYFKRIQKILARCEWVLFEQITGGTREQLKKKFLEEKADLPKENSDDALIRAIGIYFLGVESCLPLVLEGNFFAADYQKPNWVNASSWIDEGSEVALQQGIAKLPERWKKQVWDYLRKSMAAMSKGQFRKKDLASGFIRFYSDKGFQQLVWEIFSGPRDLFCFEKFDELCRKHHPRIVGIKFGAAHIPKQRQLLEERGYRLLRSEKLHSISWSNLVMHYPAPRPEYPWDNVVSAE